MPLDTDFRLYLDGLRGATTLSDFLRKRVTLKKRGNEWSGLCPFHNEKTPSFYVNDAKGFYHCFGCGAHGDALKWLREKDGLDFIGAVRTLAREIGFAEPPAPRPRTPQERKIEDRRERLLRLMESATRYYTSALQGDTPQAGKARRYLTEGRGLSLTTIAEFRLGYASSEGGDLLAHLRDQGFKDEEILASGLARKQEQNPSALRTFFFERLLFPITNTGGQVVSFGGRALSDAVRAKYINGSDTEIFSKGRLLYNLHKAAPEIRRSKTVWVVEGYMDTIALANAGIATAVAPLGTSITEYQWRLLLRQADSPILCLDGDNAGRRAALRAAETALPLLVAGKSPRFVFLPDGYDPDDIIRNAQDGKQTFATLSNTALSLADLLWSAKTEGLDFKAPELVALLDRDLNALTERIADSAMRRAYRGELRARLNASLWESRKGQQAASRYSTQARDARDKRDARDTRDKRERVGRVMASEPARISEHASALRAGLSHNRALREIRPLAMVLREPWLAAEFYENLTELPDRVPALARLRAAVLDALADCPDLDSQSLLDYLASEGFSSTLAQVLVSQEAPHGAMGALGGTPQGALGWAPQGALGGTPQGALDGTLTAVQGSEGASGINHPRGLSQGLSGANEGTQEPKQEPKQKPKQEPRQGHTRGHDFEQIQQDGEAARGEIASGEDGKATRGEASEAISGTDSKATTAEAASGEDSKASSGEASKATRGTDSKATAETTRGETTRGEASQADEGRSKQGADTEGNAEADTEGNAEGDTEARTEGDTESGTEADTEAYRKRVREEFKKSLAYCQAGESQFISFWRTRGSASLAHLKRREEAGFGGKALGQGAEADDQAHHQTDDQSHDQTHDQTDEQSHKQVGDQAATAAEGGEQVIQARGGTPE